MTDFRVTRNVPPRRCFVNDGVEVEYGGRRYTGNRVYDATLGQIIDKDPDMILCGEGCVVDEWERNGFVTVEPQTDANVSSAITAWNGTEGDEIRKDALARVDQHHDWHNTRALKAGLPKTERTHDHGFVKYEHGDKPEKGVKHPTEMDITTARQRQARSEGGDS